MFTFMYIILVAMDTASVINLSETSESEMRQGTVTSRHRDNNIQYTCIFENQVEVVSGIVQFTRDSRTVICGIHVFGCQTFMYIPDVTCGCVSSNEYQFYLDVPFTLEDHSWAPECVFIQGTRVKRETLRPPNITSVPASVNVVENASPNIDCSLSIIPGIPPSINYTWVGPGFYSKTGPVLDKVFSRTDGGHYTCTASNDAGLSDTEGVDVNVLYPPIIISVPAHYNATEFLMPNIDCSSGIEPGNPSELNYTWTGPDGFHKAGSVLSTYLYRNQSGPYSCTAVNAEDLSDSAQVEIDVLYVDTPWLSVHPAAVRENSTVEIFCNVTSKPTSHMSLRNVENAVNIGDQQQTNARSYTIQRAQCVHNGTIECLADNKDITHRLAARRELSVTCDPRYDFRKTLISQVSAVLNSMATMTVDVLANPSPVFTWRRLIGGQLQPINTDHRIENSNLKSVLSVSVGALGDYGEYVVKAENILGTFTQSYTLTQVSVPAAPEQVEVLDLASTSFTLHWTSSNNGGANQTFSVDLRSSYSEWTNWETANEDHGLGVIHTSIITGLTEDSKYLVRVYSTNVYGDSDAVVEETNTLCALGSHVVVCNDGVSQGWSLGLGALLPLVIVATLILVFNYRRRRAGG